jgi:peptidoglycan/LPS O-acetylase OafA/YrhL
MKLTYRPEIDGLRAISIIAVIFYHAQIKIFGDQFFKGGFIGVDIFFVISGYLITSIILKELLTTGSFSFKHFFERRIRRILPALLFVMLVSLPFASIYLLPSSLVDYSKSILYSLAFSSNFYFLFSGEEYGGEVLSFKPFLHTWSLSVEEQYYILFPIFLLITFKYFRKYLIYILIAGFITSLVFGLITNLGFRFITSLRLVDWDSINYTAFNFYLLPTRAWELLAGSILAYFEITKGYRSKNKTLNLILPTIGFLLIGNSILFNDKRLHALFYTLSPIIGVLLIIWFSNKDEIITKILSKKLFVSIGLISYSLYLWHYPIFAFVRIIDFVDNSIFKILIVAIIILFLSIISFYFVEKPFRSKKYNFKITFYSIIFFIFTILLLNFLIIFKNGFPKRFENFISINSFDNQNLARITYEYEMKENKKKEFNDYGKINVLILGDSHSKDLFTMFQLNNNLYANYEFRRYGYGKQDFFSFQNENALNISLKKLVESKVYHQADIILVSQYFLHNLEMQMLAKFVDFFHKRKKIILTSPNIIYKESSETYKGIPRSTLIDRFLLDQLKKNYFQNKDEIKIEDLSKMNSIYFNNRETEQMNRVNTKIKNISEEYNVTYLNKEDFQCEIKKRICFAITNEGYKTHYDYGHYTLEGAKFFGRRAFEINWFKTN